MVALSEQGAGVASAAARILLERKNESGCSNRQLADSLGWSRNTVDRYLHGERAMPLDAFYRLSRLLELDPVHVLRKAERKVAAAGMSTAPPADRWQTAPPRAPS